MEENLNSAIKKRSFTKGLIFGLIFLTLNILSFYFITTMTSSMWLMITAPFLCAFILPLVISIAFILDLRKQAGGYWVFRQAVTAAFIMFFTAYAIESVGRDVIFIKLVEPEMVQKTGQAIINATTTMLEKANTDQTKIDEKVADMQKKFDEQSKQTVGGILQGIVITIILLFVLSLIYGAIFKREPLRSSLDNTVDPAIE
jgi:hypothetical protein